MKTRLLTIATAVVLALVGVVAVLAYAHQANERAVNGLKAETVLVANGVIRAGTSLSTAQQEQLLSTEKVPESSLAPTAPAVGAVTAANGHLVVTANVAKGQILLQNMLTSSAGVSAGGGFVIPSGMMAISVHMCADEAVAEYVTPGAYVAVFDTWPPPGSITRTCDAAREITGGNVIASFAATNTQLVLPKAEVLAVGLNPAGAGTSGSSSVTVTTDPAGSSQDTAGEVYVTLAVSQYDAERLILMEEEGLPYMALLGSNSNVVFPQQQPVNLFPGSP